MLLKSNIRGVCVCVSQIGQIWSPGMTEEGRWRLLPSNSGGSKSARCYHGPCFLNSLCLLSKLFLSCPHSYIFFWPLLRQQRQKSPKLLRECAKKCTFYSQLCVKLHICVKLHKCKMHVKWYTFVLLSLCAKHSVEFKVISITLPVETFTCDWICLLN